MSSYTPQSAPTWFLEAAGPRRAVHFRGLAVHRRGLTRPGVV